MECPIVNKIKYGIIFITVNLISFGLTQEDNKTEDILNDIMLVDSSLRQNLIEEAVTTKKIMITT